MDKNILKKDIGEEDLPSIEIEDIEDLEVYAYSDKVVTLKNNTLNIYNTQAKLQTTINVTITKPKFASSGKYLLLADEGGEDLYLIYNDSLQWHKTLEGNISQISVNENGATCAILTGTTHKSVIEMYDILGKEEFKTILASTTATNAIISNDNKYLSFVEIKTSGTAIESKVKTISVEKAKKTPEESMINTYTMPAGTLILKIKYKKNKIVTYCDDSIHILSEGKDEEILKIGNNISFADINLNGYICSITEGESISILRNEYELQIKNIENQKINTYIINSPTKNLYCNNDIIAVSLGNEIEFINTRGWLVKKFTSIQTIKELIIGDSVVAIVYRNRIEVMSI